MDGTAKPVCTEILQNFYALHGDPRDIEAVQQIRYEHERLMNEVAAEREAIRANDELLPFELSSEARANLRQIGGAIPRIDQIWIARRVTELLTERPMLVVVVAPTRWKLGLGGNAQKLAQEVLAQMQLGIDADLLVIALTSSTSWLYKKMKKIEGSSVYQKRA